MNIGMQYEEDDQVLDFSEMNTDLIKFEPKEEDQSGQDTDEAEEDFENCSTNHQDQELKLIRQSSLDFALVSDLYSLLEDYKTMACSSKSLLCCQPAVCHAYVECMVCGENFMATADRLLKLCKHFECVHPMSASELILEAMQRYEVLILHMRKALEFDKCFGSTHYEPEARILLPRYI